MGPVPDTKPQSSSRLFGQFGLELEILFFRLFRIASMHQLPRVASFVAPKHPTELTDEDDEEFLRVIFFKESTVIRKETRSKGGYCIKKPWKTSEL